MPKSNKDIYQQITDMIIQKLEEGVIPWQKPWRGGVNDWPRNLATGRQYTGINVFILTALSREYDSPYWLTYRQAKELGGHVRKGEKSTVVVFWTFLDREMEDDDGEKKIVGIPYLRQYRVFNVEQCEGLKRTVPKGVEEPSEEDKLDFNPIEACDNVKQSYKDSPHIRTDKKACYNKTRDEITMPAKELFLGEEEYYCTLFHEFVHSTGSENRLKRSGITSRTAAFGSEEYSEEELVAEFGASLLCGVTGISPRTIDNSAAYIKGWLKKLRDDKKMAVMAAARSQKAADYILGTKKAEA